MANIVDALLVTLGLETKGYEKGIKQSEKDLQGFDKKRSDSEKNEHDRQSKADKEREQRHKKQQQQNKETYQSLAKVRNQLLGVMTLFTAGQGLLAFAKGSMNAAANVGRLSENTEIAVSELSGLEQAFARTGGTAEDAQATIGMLAKNIANMKSGQESNVSEFLRWGGDINHGQLKDAKSYLLGIADLLQKISKTSPSKALMVAGRLGLSETALNLAKQGRKALEAQIAAGAKMSAVNKQQADEAREAQRAWADMSSMLASIARAVLFPILKGIGSWMKNHQKDIQGWLVSLRQFLSSITPDAIAKVGEEFHNIADAIMSIAAAVKALRPIMDKLGLTNPENVKAPGTLAKASKMTGAFLPFQMLMTGAHLAMDKGKQALGMGNNDNSVHIGTMTVNTKATDAHGVAAGMHDALKHRNLATQANG